MSVADMMLDAYYFVAVYSSTHGEGMMRKEIGSVCKRDEGGKDRFLRRSVEPS